MALAVDATSSATDTSASNLSWSHTCTGSDLALFVGLVVADLTDSDRPISGSPTYNGVSMTQVATINDDTNNYTMWIYKLANPATGTNTISASTTGSVLDFTGQAISYTGADQTDPEDVSGTNEYTNGSPTITLNSVSANSFIFGNFFSTQSVGTKITSDYTSIQVFDAGGDTMGGAYRSTTTSGNYALSWTDTDNDEDGGVIAVSVKEASGGGTHNIVVQDATHSHSADQPAITQTHAITSADSTHSHTADSPTLTQTHEISTEEATHSHSADNATISQAHEIAVQESSHAHTADEPTITQTHEISVEEATHSHTADNVTVSVGDVAIDTNDSTHGHTSDSPTITQTHQIAVDDSTHSHTADNITVTVDAEVNIVVQESSHGHTASQPEIGTLHHTYEDITPLPTGKAALANNFTQTNYTEVATDDASTFDLEGSDFLVVMITEEHTNTTDEITINWNGKSTLAPTSSTIYLQIWNENGSTWETLDSDNTTAADTELTLTGSKTTSLSNYYDGTTVRARVYQEVA